MPSLVPKIYYEPLMNIIVHVVCKIMKNIIAPAAKAEVGVIFISKQDTTPIKTTLIEINHYQRPTPIQVDNSIAVGIANIIIKQRQSKSMGMRFY